MKKAENYYTEAIKNGSLHAMISLGKLLHFSEIKRYEEGLEWFEKAHKHGHKLALLYLGYAYRQEREGNSNINKALYYFE